MAVCTDLASVAAATAAGYKLHEYTLAGEGGHSGTVKVTILEKQLNGPKGQTSTRLEAVGQDSSSVTTARTNALSALNAKRRHRYCGTPGAASGCTVVNFSDGLATTPTVDTD